MCDSDTDPTKLSHQTQHQNIWSLHPSGGDSIFLFTQHENLCLHLQFVTHVSMYLQIAKLYPGLMMKLLVKTVKSPVITFEPNNATIQTSGTVTAYAIQPNATLTPLFVLNLVGDPVVVMMICCYLKTNKKALEKSHHVVTTGQQRQHPSVREWNESRWSCHPEQVSY